MKKKDMSDMRHIIKIKKKFWQRKLVVEHFGKFIYFMAAKIVFMISLKSCLDGRCCISGRCISICCEHYSSYIHTAVDDNH